MLTRNKYTRLLADAYYEAALGNVDMQKAAAAFEAIRAAINEKLDYLPVWDALDRQIGKAEGKPLQRALMKLRERFVQRVYETEIARLDKIFRIDPQEGWVKWLTTYSSAFVNSRGLLCKALTEQDFPFPEHYRLPVASLRQATRYTQQSLFVEAFEAYVYLAEQTILPDAERISNLVDAAKIQLYLTFNLDKAQELLERAAELSPAHSAIKGGWGLYWAVQNKFQEAQLFFDEAIKLDPELIDSYLLVGDAYDSQNKFDEAETWFNKAVEVNCGKSWGYIRLLRLYGHKELFEKHRDQLEGLLERANRVDPESVYANLLDLGYVYQQNKQDDEANRWYNKAIKLDTTWVNGYIFMGNAVLEKGEHQQAVEAYQKVIAVAPEIFEGYWYMGRLYEQQERWQEALPWYQKSLPLCKELEGTIRAKISEMRLKLGQYDVAEKELVEMLEHDPGNQTVINTLESLATEYCEKNKDLSATLRVYNATWRIKEQARGRSYEATYLNLVGNAYYYFGNYQTAIDEYTLAIKANPEDAVLYSNIAGAWENRKQPGSRLVELDNAVQALRKALELSPANSEYTGRLENLLLQQKLVRQFGEPGLKLTPVIRVLEVGVAPDMVSYVADDTTSGKVKAPLQELVNAMRERLRQDIGLVLPGINFKDIPGAEAGRYFLTLSDTLLASERMPPGKRFLPVETEKLPVPLQIEKEEGVNPQTGETGYWVNEADAIGADAINRVPTVTNDGVAGVTLWEVMEYPLRHFEALLRANAVELVDQQQVTWLLDPLKTPVAEQIRKSPEKRISLIHVLKALLQEGVPVTAFEVICNTFIEGKDKESDLLTIVEMVRSRPGIRPTLPGNNERYWFYPLGQEIEAELAGFLYDEDQQPLLVMNLELLPEMLRVIGELLFEQKWPALLVANAKLRPFVRKIIEWSYPQIPVLSERELLPGLESQIVGKKEGAHHE